MNETAPHSLKYNTNGLKNQFCVQYLDGVGQQLQIQMNALNCCVKKLKTPTTYKPAIHTLCLFHQTSVQMTDMGSKSCDKRVHFDCVCAMDTVDKGWIWLVTDNTNGTCLGGSIVHIKNDVIVVGHLVTVCRTHLVGTMLCLALMRNANHRSYEIEVNKIHSNDQEHIMLCAGFMRHDNRLVRTSCITLCVEGNMLPYVAQCLRLCGAMMRQHAKIHIPYGIKGNSKYNNELPHQR